MIKVGDWVRVKARRDLFSGYVGIVTKIEDGFVTVQLTYKFKDEYVTFIKKEDELELYSDQSFKFDFE